MSERPDHKAWSAAAAEAYEFFAEHGGDEMAPEDWYHYDQMIADIQDKAARHDRSKNDGGAC